MSDILAAGGPPDSSAKDIDAVKKTLVEALPRLRAFARFLCGKPDRADDLVQETVVKAIGNLDKFKPGTNLNAWLFTILRNQFYSEARRRMREVEDDDGRFAASLSQQPEQEDVLGLRDLLRLLHRLPDEQREALTLVGACGYSYQEASAIAGIAVGTVKSRVYRARERLEELMAAPGPRVADRPMPVVAFA